jgi:hypothetical protein
VVHFQASYANECWQFDVSPSDLKALPEPPAWIDERRGGPVLMLYSVVDDCNGGYGLQQRFFRHVNGKRPGDTVGI